MFGMMAVLVTATGIAMLYFAREVFVPTTLAILLSFLLAPAVRWLRRLRVGRVTAVGFTAMLAFMAIAGFAAVVVGEISSLAQQLPEYRYNLQTKIRSLPGMVPGGGFYRRATEMFGSSARSFRGWELRVRRRARAPLPARQADACPGRRALGFFDRCGCEKSAAFVSVLDGDGHWG